MDNMPERKAYYGKRHKRVSRARYPVADWYKYDERSSGRHASVQSAFFMYDDWKRAERSGEKNDAGLLLGKLEAKRQRTGIH